MGTLEGEAFPPGIRDAHTSALIAHETTDIAQCVAGYCRRRVLWHDQVNLNSGSAYTVFNAPRTRGA